MAGEFVMDELDWRIVVALQRDGRRSYAELSRAVNMSASALTERVRRLEEAGIISGYRAEISLDRVGLSILAFVRLRYPSGNYRPFERLVAATPEVIEAHHVTGEDCFLLKVAVRSMRHLETVTGRLAALGPVTTTVVYSSPLPYREITPAAAGFPPAGAGAIVPPDGAQSATTARGFDSGHPAAGAARPGQSVPNSSIDSQHPRPERHRWSQGSC